MFGERFWSKGSRYGDAFHFPCIFQSNMRGQQWVLSHPPIPFPGRRPWMAYARLVKILIFAWPTLYVHSAVRYGSMLVTCWLFFEPWAYDTFCGTGSCRNLSKCQRCTWKPSQGFVEGGGLFRLFTHCTFCTLAQVDSVLKRKVRVCRHAMPGATMGVVPGILGCLCLFLTHRPAESSEVFPEPAVVTTTDASESWSWRGFGIGSSTQVAK